MTNSKHDHQLLLTLLAGIGSPDELEAVFAAVESTARKIRDKISGKQANSLAYWGAATRLAAGAKHELKEIRS